MDNLYLEVRDVPEHGVIVLDTGPIVALSIIKTFRLQAQTQE